MQTLGTKHKLKTQAPQRLSSSWGGRQASSEHFDKQAVLVLNRYLLGIEASTPEGRRKAPEALEAKGAHGAGGSEGSSLRRPLPRTV